MGKKKLDVSDTAIDVAGGVLGAAIGLIPGHNTALMGAALSPIFSAALKDLRMRVSSNREQQRLDSATVYVADSIIKNIQAGKIVRQDDFFQGENNFSSEGAELLEGVLLKCRAQYQEKKVQLIANIFKNIAFDATISAQMAYQVLSMADGLTYQNLCLLSYFGRRQDFLEFQILKEPFSMYPDAFGIDTWVVAHDILELYNRGILSSQSGFMESTSITPSNIGLTVRGKGAFDLMDLNSIPNDDVLAVIRPLEYKAHFGTGRFGLINGEKPLA
ncbi:hypothetical protein F1C16_03070 [Hymenobacter sp. NBH84]|uniref:hypothetical protein n=1 Tax=Hymenobacter sp. NBH84 TaxID=2596915 RepID=UPI001629EBD2|nr:hypothetical protein [Hymenobacter sp. NBH84]QNE38605.1 hypothetical protein F1C16_03070 [Hymenobacter sp. NBH84]